MYVTSLMMKILKVVLMKDENINNCRYSNFMDISNLLKIYRRIFCLKLIKTYKNIRF